MRWEGLDDEQILNWPTWFSWVAFGVFAFGHVNGLACLGKE